MHKIVMRRMDACSFQTALELWNEGFQGYFLDLTLSLGKFLARISSEGLSPEYSFAAFVDDKPAGFLWNGIRQHAGSSIAWNGGTGVVPTFRGHGVGRSLVQAALDLYAEKNVSIAMLEAISKNEPAISLYKDCGYEVTDELTSLQIERAVELPATSSSYHVENVFPATVGTLNFYREISPWQSQWQSLAAGGGQAIVVVDSSGSPVGYALFKKRFDEEGKLTSIALYQCEVAPDTVDAESALLVALRYVFASDPGNYRCTTHNLRKSNNLVVALLMDSGFTTFIEQLFMIRTME